jgi:hypothetical protein
MNVWDLFKPTPPHELSTDDQHRHRHIIPNFLVIPPFKGISKPTKDHSKPKVEQTVNVDDDDDIYEHHYHHDTLERALSAYPYNRAIRHSPTLEESGNKSSTPASPSNLQKNNEGNNDKEQGENNNDKSPKAVSSVLKPLKNNNEMTEGNTDTVVDTNAIGGSSVDKTTTNDDINFVHKEEESDVVVEGTLENAEIGLAQPPVEHHHEHKPINFKLFISLLVMRHLVAPVIVLVQCFIFGSVFNNLEKHALTLIAGLGVATIPFTVCKLFVLLLLLLLLLFRFIHVQVSMLSG